MFAPHTHQQQLPCPPVGGVVVGRAPGGGHVVEQRLQVNHNQRHGAGRIERAQRLVPVPVGGGGGSNRRAQAQGQGQGQSQQRGRGQGGAAPIRAAPCAGPSGRHRARGAPARGGGRGMPMVRSEAQRQCAQTTHTRTCSQPGGCSCLPRTRRPGAAEPGGDGGGGGGGDASRSSASRWDGTGHCGQAPQPPRHALCLARRALRLLPAFRRAPSMGGGRRLIHACGITAVGSW